MKSKNYDISVSEFGRAVSKLARRLKAAAVVQNLSMTEFSVLSHIDKTGPATTAELARVEGVKPQSMGAVVADLEARKLVARKPHPTDGRQMNITLTAKGKEMREAARLFRRAWINDAVSKLDPGEKELLVKVTGIIKRLADS